METSRMAKERSGDQSSLFYSALMEANSEQINPPFIIQIARYEYGLRWLTYFRSRIGSKLVFFFEKIRPLSDKLLVVCFLSHFSLQKTSKFGIFRDERAHDKRT